MSSLGLPFTCLGAKVWKWKVEREVQMEEGDALNGGELAKEAEMPVHSQVKAKQVWKSPLYYKDSWGESANTHITKWAVSLVPASLERSM